MTTATGNRVIMSNPPHFVCVRGCFSEIAGERCCRTLSFLLRSVDIVAKPSKPAFATSSRSV
jgi:hypothetical protein